MSKWALPERRRCYALLIVTDGKLQVTGDNTLLLVITGRVASKLKNLGSKVFENGSEVDWRWMANESVS